MMVHLKSATSVATKHYQFLSLFLVLFLAGSAFLAFNAGGQAHASTLTNSRNSAAQLAQTAAVNGSTVATIAEGQVGGTCDNYYGCPDPGEWCSDFARWVWDQAGIDIRELSGASSSFYDYGQNHGTLSNTPQVGDAVVYGYNASSNWAQHVAIVTSVNTSNGTITDVGGNENNTVQSDGPYNWTVGGSPTGQVISGYIAPVGLTSGSTQSIISPNGPLALDSAGKLVAFAIGSDKQLYQDYQTKPAAGPWSGVWPLGGSNLLGNPVAALDSAGKLVVFAIGSDGQLYQDYQTKPAAGPWSGLSSLGGGNLVGSPAVSLDSAGKLVVFALGSDGQLYQDYQTRPAAGPWSGVWPLGGGHLVGSPAVSLDSAGKLVVIAIGTDGQLYQDWQTKPAAGPWSGLSSLGGGNLIYV